MTNPPPNPMNRPPQRLAAAAALAAGAGLGGPPTAALSKRVQAVRALRDLMSRNEHEAALKHVAGLPPKLRDDAEIQFLHAWALEACMRYGPAAKLAKIAIDKHPHPDAMLVLARCYRAMGKTEACLEWCDRIAAKVRDPELVECLRAGALEEAGRFAEATGVLEPFAARYVGSSRSMTMAMRLEWSKLLVQNKRYDEAHALIDETLASDAPQPVRNTLLFLQAKAFDRSGKYAEAFTAAAAANEIGRIEFDPALYQDQVSTLIENWSRENMAHFPLSRCGSPVPVFVAGMPRSGTSLIDQIIDAHPLASGVGELNSIERFASELSAAWDPSREQGKWFGAHDERRWTRAADAYAKEIAGLAPAGTQRIVNKALGNNKLVGLIARLFPNTRIIHAVRDPRDVAVSCFMGGFNNRLHAWTTRIDWTANAWGQSLRMMEHWKKVLNVPILTVHYEHLVADPETQFPRIIDFLGLEWDDKCFEFHKSRRTVRTLSYDQVNRPLYTSSSGRHSNYAPFLEGVDFPPYDPQAEDPLTGARQWLGLE